MPTINKAKTPPWLDRYKRQPFGSKYNNSNKFYKTKRWLDLRAYQLNRFPLCNECLKQGKTTAATVADHVQPIRLGGAPLLLANLQSLCAPCHNSKTAKESHTPTKY